MTRRKPPKAPETLPDDDLALWQMVAERIGPAKGKPRVTDVELDADRPPSRFQPAGRGELPHAGRKRSSPVSAPQKPASAKAPPPEPTHVVLERRRARRIARGAEEIEARIDLHGMTQDDAHAALSGFIRRCHADGLRTVLVITGKGGTGRAKSDHDENWYVHAAHRPRGVLKRNVPIWLGQPGLAPLVVNWSTAHVRHGGEGALYVHIRVKR